jgi:NAD(P)-dependent dehydrogenase (short-subunit alcohol dehydrogenase family)
MEGCVLITGANSSLAIPAVDHLLSNYPNLTAVLTVRNLGTTDANTQRLREVLSMYPTQKAHLHSLDLASLPQVATFSKEIAHEISAGRLPPFVSIICNAFAWSISGGLKYSHDGYELSMAVNHLAHLSLVMRLLGSFSETGRITFLASDTHYPGKSPLQKFPPVLPDDLDLLIRPPSEKQGEEIGRGFQRYGVSKLAIITVMYELNRRLAQVS